MDFCYFATDLKRTSMNIKKWAIALLASFLTSVSTQAQLEPMATGSFQPTWESLANYQVPEWYRDAKFGIWAHWGPQCQPEQGDWFARFMYAEGSPEYNWFVKNYGPQSKLGFKDICNDWKAEKWNPERLVKLYKRAGAQYFFAMGNHHDNMDMWNSKYQPWNSVNIGPKKDILEGWANAARKNKLFFGVSIHAAHAWLWYETAQRADKSGPNAGKPYDGKLTKEDGKGTWWEGMDPQALYAQNHPLSRNSDDLGAIHRQWGWDADQGVTLPDQAYCDNFYNRTVDMINKYKPDLLYFDDTALPLWPASDAGLRIAAHYYNTSARDHAGVVNNVIFGKILTPEQREAMVWDVEMGAPDQIQEEPWQTCTCIGSWHYKRSIYEKKGYKSASTVIRMLTDVVSKNGNLLLNIPVRGDGSIDELEEQVVKEIADWMDVNKEGIFGTRPWKVFGEGPVAETANPINAQGFNEGMYRKFTEKEIRFTTKGKVLYAHVLGWPAATSVTIKSLAAGNSNLDGAISSVEILGAGKAKYERNAQGMVVQIPTKKPNPISFTVKITTL